MQPPKGMSIFTCISTEVIDTEEKDISPRLTVRFCFKLKNELNAWRYVNKIQTAKKVSLNKAVILALNRAEELEAQLAHDDYICSQIIQRLKQSGLALSAGVSAEVPEDSALDESLVWLNSL